MNNYLKDISIDFKLSIIDKIKKDYHFEDYINNCIKFKINIFDHNKINEKKKIIEKLSNKKKKLFENYKYNINNSNEIKIENLEYQLKKFKLKYDILDKMINYTYKFYSFNLFEIIEFDKSLFINSEEFNNIKYPVLQFDIPDKNNNIIDEYSN